MDLWTLGQGDGDVVLPMLAYFVRTWGASPPGGIPLWFVKIYVSIVRAVPDIPIDEAVKLARTYRGRDPFEMAEVNEYLAFAPWRSQGHAAAHIEAAERDMLTDWWPRDTPSTNWAIKGSEILQSRMTGDRHPAEVHDEAVEARRKGKST